MLALFLLGGPKFESCRQSKLSSQSKRRQKPEKPGRSKKFIGNGNAKQPPDVRQVAGSRSGVTW